MRRMVPLNKRSKRAQREYHSRRRGSWLGLDPVTRTVESKKAYDRKQIKQADRRRFEDW